MFLSSIHFKFDIEFLVLKFFIGRWSVDWWLVDIVSSWLVGGRWLVIGGQLVGW